MNKILNSRQVLHAFFLTTVILLGERVLELIGLINTFNSLAYELDTHQFIVEDAIKFMVHEKSQTNEDSSHISDFHLLRKVLAPTKGEKHNKTQATQLIFESSHVLAEASRDTDNMRDIWIHAGGSMAELSGISFTVFSHFLNIRSPRSLYPEEGYHFGWVRANTSCSVDRNADDIWANFFVDHAAGKFDIKKSDAYKYYKHPRLKGVTEAELAQNFNQDIEHIHFWPITNLATYWYNEFQNSPAGRDFKPLNLYHFGPVLHAAADTTVPFHAVGLSGCGHGLFEEGVNGSYKSELFYDPELVKKYLRTMKYLNVDSSIENILIGNAIYASSNCECKLNSCHCNDVIRDIKTMKELVNLAIASTVVVIRKGFNDWDQTKRPLIFTTYNPKPSENNISLPSEVWGDWDSTTIPAFPSRFERVSSLFSWKLSNHINNLKISAGRYVDKSLSWNKYIEGNKKSSTQFWNFIKQQQSMAQYSSPLYSPDIPVFMGHIDVWTDSRTSKYPGMPPIGPEPILRLRPPTPEEIRDDHKWENYLKVRQKFHQARQILYNSIRLSSLENKLRQSYDEKERTQIKEAIATIQKKSQRIP